MSPYPDMVTVLMVTSAAVANLFTAPPLGGVTLHVSVVPSEIPRLRSLPRRVVWPFTQCFTEVSVVVDPPHGGKTYGASRQSAPVYLPSGLWDPRELRARVRRAMTPTVQMLVAHCRRRPRLRIDVLNHTRLEPWMARTFVDPAVPDTVDPVFRDARPTLPRHQRFFKNTVMYVWSMATSNTRYLLHVDIDTLGLVNHRPAPRQSPPPTEFVDRAVRITELQPSTLFVTPTSCNALKSVKQVFTIGLRVFLVHVPRFKTMLPLRMWADHVEDMLAYNMRRTAHSTCVLPFMPCIGSSYITRVLLKNTNW